MVSYDLETANQMFKTGRYVYVIAIEKSLKSIVCLETKEPPPRTHDLIYLITLGKVRLNQEFLDFVGKINNAGVVTRYPEDLKKLVSSYPKTSTHAYLVMTRKVIRCLNQHLKSRK